MFIHYPIEHFLSDICWICQSAIHRSPYSLCGWLSKLCIHQDTAIWCHATETAIKQERYSSASSVNPNKAHSSSSTDRVHHACCTKLYSHSGVARHADDHSAFTATRTKFNPVSKPYHDRGSEVQHMAFTRSPSDHHRQLCHRHVL